MISYCFLGLLISCSQPTKTGLDTSLGQSSSEPGDTEEPSSEPSDPSSDPTTDNDDDGFDSAEDCNDDDSSINPEATDIANDGIDQDCSGTDYIDGLCTDDCDFANDGDCDDGGPYSTSPLCELGTDCSDCGARDDLDEDGFYDDQGVGGFNDDNALLDCDDSNPDINPDATEVSNDGIDQDCNGEDLTELCLDTCETADDGECDDGGSNSNSDSCDLGTDCSDCGERYDGDLDGFDDEQDCDDSNPDINPDANDYCNGIDEDCDGHLDDDFDETEPNDANLPYYIGSVEDGTLFTIGHIAYEGDQDGYHVYAYDGWTSSPAFSCTIEAPPDLNLEVSLFNVQGSLIETIETELGGEATVAMPSDTPIFDDTGNYLLLIEALEGNSCTSSYSISCQET